MCLFNLSPVVVISTIIIELTYGALDCCSCRSKSFKAYGTALCQANNPNNECQDVICMTGDPRFQNNPDPYCCNNRWDSICVHEANIICTDTPSPIPASPVAAPTSRPTFGFQKCIDEWPLFGGEGWLSIDTDHISKKFLAKIHGPANTWFGVGFGNHVMNGTYAVITSDIILTVKERLLDNHAMGTEQTSSFIQFASSEINGKREIQFIRDYNNIIDFNDWFDCKNGNGWLNIISAIGSELSFTQHVARFNTDSLWSCLCPTDAPTGNPTSDPSIHPTNDPTNDPTSDPTTFPTTDPSIDPTMDPTSDPTIDPTTNPTKYPSINPTIDPTSDPTTDPTYDPTTDPSIDPTMDPTSNPTSNPTSDPTDDPTLDPTTNPTKYPSIYPTIDPTSDPTTDPTVDPTSYPTSDPSNDPTTYSPTSDPTQIPTFDPTFTYNPTEVPTKTTNAPSIDPTKDPTFYPTIYPTTYPTTYPTYKPSIYHSNEPTIEPTLNPTNNPTSHPSVYPSIYPTESRKTTSNKEEVTVIEEESKITVVFGFNMWWVWLLLIVPYLCIICGCFLCIICKQRYGVIRKDDTKTNISMVPSPSPSPGTHPVNTDIQFNKQKETEYKKKKGMGNKTLMNIIDVVNDGSKLKTDVIMEEPREAVLVYNDDIYMNIESDHDIHPTMVIKLSSQNHQNVQQTMIIKPLPSPQHSETVETRTYDNIHDKQMNVEKPANCQYSKSDSDIILIHELVNNPSDNNKYDMSETYESTKL